MATRLDTPQVISLSYDEAALIALSKAQNGGCVEIRPALNDAKTEMVGFESHYALDLSAYVPPAITGAQQWLLDYASAKQNEILAGAWSFNVAAPNAAPHTVTTNLDASGQNAMLKLGVWVVMNLSTSPAPTMPYSNVDSTSTTLSFTEVQSLVAQAGAVNINSYKVFNPVCDQIRSGKITTTDAVDSALAAIRS